MAIDAVKEWKFTPFKDAGGKPVKAAFHCESI
jgi:hypothetical protein